MDYYKPALQLNSSAYFAFLYASQRGCVCACTWRSKAAQTAPSGLQLGSLWRGFASEAAGDGRTAGTTSSVQAEDPTGAEVLEEHPASCEVCLLLFLFLPCRVPCLIAY